MSDNYTGSGYWFAVESQFSWTVCDPALGLVADLDVKVPGDKERAHLIAAAPELYDILRRLCGLAEDGNIASLDSSWFQAREILAKARGES